MKKFNKKYTQKKQVKVEPVVITTPDQVDQIEEQIVNDIINAVVEQFSGKLDSLGFTKNQVVKTLENSRDVLVALARGEVAEEIATRTLTENVIKHLVGHERLLTTEEVNALVRAVENNMDVKAIVENLGITKKELKSTIETYVEKTFKDMGIIPEKLVNGLYKVIRDNWEDENLNSLIRKELLVQGTESFKALQDMRISEFFKMSESIKLETILSFKEAAVKEDKKFEEDKELESIKATLRRTNPDLADRLIFKESVDITSGVDGVKVIDINRNKTNEKRVHAITGVADRLKSFNHSMLASAVKDHIKDKSVNL